MDEGTLQSAGILLDPEEIENLPEYFKIIITELSDPALTRTWQERFLNLANADLDGHNISGDDTTSACKKTWKYKALKRWQEFRDMVQDQTDSSTIYNGVGKVGADMVDVKQASSDTVDKKSLSSRRRVLARSQGKLKPKRRRRPQA